MSDVEEIESAMHEREGSSCRRVLVRCSRIAGYLFFVYATTYFLVMDTVNPAFDPVTWNVAYDSSCLFGPIHRMPGGLTIDVCTPCWANRFFWPMDCLVQPLLKPCNKAILGR